MSSFMASANAREKSPFFPTMPSVAQGFDIDAGIRCLAECTVDCHGKLRILQGSDTSIYPLERPPQPALFITVLKNCMACVRQGIGVIVRIEAIASG